MATSGSGPLSQVEVRGLSGLGTRSEQPKPETPNSTPNSSAHATLFSARPTRERDILATIPVCNTTHSLPIPCCRTWDLPTTCAVLRCTWYGTKPTYESTVKDWREGEGGINPIPALNRSPNLSTLGHRLPRLHIFCQLM